MKKIFHDNWILLAILGFGFFLRIYSTKELYMYTHDQDLEGWFIKDVLVNKHIRLIGQETSTQGIFIGPLFYYLLIPFYLISNMDPIGGVLLVLLLGLFTIFSFYWVLSNIFNRNTGLIAALFYAVSFYAVFNDREVVPTMPVILWSVWFLWGIYQLFKGNQKFAFPFIGILFALTWHLNVALVLLIPLIFVSQFLSKKNLDTRYLINGILALFIFSLPFFVFEFRHGFSQTQSLLNAFSTNQQDIISGSDKVSRTFLIFSKDIHNLLWGDEVNIGYNVDLLILILIFAAVTYGKLINRKLVILFIVWLLLFLSFFSLYSKRLSEYYLNGTIVIMISVFSVFISSFLQKKKLAPIAFFAILILVLINIDRFFKNPINKSGYVERKAVVSEIKNDSQKRGYPCVSISYITNPGYDRGYRYFLWLEKVKLKTISDKVPVYTIVFPQKPIFKTDKDFGAIGLIYPDYEKYNTDVVKDNCVGDDFNMTDSMIGYTQ